MSGNPYGVALSATTDNPFGVAVQQAPAQVNGVVVPQERITSGLNPMKVGAEMMDVGNALWQAAIGTGRDVGAALNSFAEFAPTASALRHATPGQMPAIAEQERTLAAAKPTLTQEQTLEQEDRIQRGMALLGSLAFEEGIVGVKAFARPFLQRAAAGTAAGALYGLLRPQEDGESISDAILKDAALFGGANLALGGVAAGVRLLEASRAEREQAARVVAEYKALDPTLGTRMAGEVEAAERLEPPAITRRTGQTTEQLMVAERNKQVELDRQANIAFNRQARDVVTLQKVEIGEEQSWHPKGSKSFAYYVKRGDEVIADIGGYIMPNGMANLDVGGPGAGSAGMPTVRAALREFQRLHPEVTHVMGARETGARAFAAGQQGATEVNTVAHIDLTRQAKLDTEAASSGKAVADQLTLTERYLKSERGALTTGPIAPPPIPPSLASQVDVVLHPRDLGPYGAFFAPPHTWDKIHPIAGAVVNDAINRSVVASQKVAEYATLIKRTKKALSKAERIELSNLLDQHATAAQLPGNVPAKLATWFGEWRTSLARDRHALQQLVGAPPSWGIDAYMMHVFVGDWRVVDDVGKAIQGMPGGGFFKTMPDALAAAGDALKQNPAIQLRVEPNKFVWDQDAAVALGPRQYWRFVRAASSTLQIPTADIQSLLSHGNVTRPSARAKWFGSAQPRRANLQGFIPDVTEAAAIYSRGLARKLAYHDFEAVTQKALEKLPPELPNLKAALSEYTDRVLGRPGIVEKSWNSYVNYLFQGKPINSRLFQLQTLTGGARKFESLWRLGYSPTSAFVNYSQTWINTASKIGYVPVARAHAMLMKALVDSKAGAQIDQLLEQFGVSFHVPLSNTNIYQDVGRMALWHPLYLFNKAETVNRAVAGLSAYTHALNSGATPAAAVDAARDFIRVTQFHYGVADLPKVLANPLGSVLGQFKPFLINELHFMASLRGAELARFVANVTAAGGVTALFSLPPLLAVDAAAKALTGESVSERIERNHPKAARGIPGALGIDIGRNVAPGPQWPMDLTAGPFAGDVAALLKLAPDVAHKLVNGNGTLDPRERSLAIRRLMQVQVRRVVDAWAINRDGKVVQPTTGIEIFTPSDPRLEAVETLLGARSIERAEHERELTTVKGITDVLDVQRRNYIEQILKLREQGNNEGAAQLRRAARDRGVVITADMLHAARDAKRHTALEDALRRSPHAGRAALRQHVGTTLEPDTDSSP